MIHVSAVYDSRTYLHLVILSHCRAQHLPTAGPKDQFSQIKPLTPAFQLV
jgi:hypothetical protein